MYYDILAQLKNAVRARKETIHVPYSRFDLAVLEALKSAKYVEDVEKRTAGKKTTLAVTLRYEHGAPAVRDFRIVSKPSRRQYKGYKELLPVRQHYGIAVLSTPRGVMSNRMARKEKVGGEYLFEIW